MPELTREKFNEVSGRHNRGEPVTKEELDQIFAYARYYLDDRDSRRARMQDRVDDAKLIGSLVMAHAVVSGRVIPIGDVPHIVNKAWEIADAVVEGVFTRIVKK